MSVEENSRLTNLAADLTRELAAQREYVRGLENERLFLIRWHAEDAEEIQRLMRELEDTRLKMTNIRSNIRNGGATPEQLIRTIKHMIGELEKECQ